MEPKRLGRPPKYTERPIRTTVALQPSDLARLDAVPGATRADRIITLLDAYEHPPQYSAPPGWFNP